MDHGQEIRRKANVLRKLVCSSAELDPDSLLQSDSLIVPLISKLELDLCPEAPESPNLQGALAAVYDDIIFINAELQGGYRDFCIVHEAAHQVLHTFRPKCSEEDIDEVSIEEEVPTAKARVIGYGPHERAEREANLFALEFLLPCAALRKAFVEDCLTASQIAEKAGMPEAYVKRQIARAVLIPPYDRLQPVDASYDRLQPVDAPYDRLQPVEDPRSRAAQTEVHGTDAVSLNPSQKLAAETEECPALVSAGPGTGKTLTLIHRIVHLLENGTDPNRILALTFSNKAAEEMRERIAEARPDDAARIQIMTFHAFGFNLLRRYWKEAGIESDSGIIDQIDSLLMLENHLADLKLEHYLALYDPMRDLPDVLSAISKAKDELCGPEKYRKLAEEMLAGAEEEADVIKAEKALETARVYGIYQHLLDQEKILDFGDLILRPVRMLESNSAVLNEVRGLYDHILVDEFQDVNRASGVLLRLVAGQGKGLWAVGDLRQSIYRWRGASPENIRKFEEEYEGSTRFSLEVNYRSLKPIVDLFGAFGRTMIAREPFNEWEAYRGEAEGKAVTYDVSDVFETEAGRIANLILGNSSERTEFRDQAVICRTHAQLASVGDALTARGVPVFYLGQLFERSEVRDLLSILDLASSNNSQALLRVGWIEEYGLSVGEVFSVNALCSEKGSGVPGIDPDDPALELSGEGRESLKTLIGHLHHEPSDSAYDLLSDYLFNRSKYLRPLVSDETVQGKQQLIAVYQLLSFAAAMESRFADSDDPIKDFLQYIRRLVMFREQKNLAEIPAAAAGLDAVRLLTVHGAKGLEFGAVCLPYLAKGKIPASWRGEKCPTPPGLRSDPKEDHEEEEECLFFVSLSRARDRLHLSRAINYSDYRKSAESPFLSRLEESLPEPVNHSSSGEPEEPDPVPPPAYTRSDFYAAELDRYIHCPRQYFYRYKAGLKGVDNRSAFQKLHGAVFHTLRAVRDAPADVGDIGAFAREKFDEFWEEAEIGDHPYAVLYREKGEELLGKVIERFGGADGVLEELTVSVPLSNGVVRVSSDFVQRKRTGGLEQISAWKVKTGKKPKNVEKEHADVMIYHGLSRENPDAEVSVKKVFLTDDSEEELNITETLIKNRSEKYEEAIGSINRGEFDPDPDDRKCPACAYFFICGSKAVVEPASEA